MTYEELSKKVEDLALDVDRLSKMKNIPTQDIEPLKTQIKTSQGLLNERYRIGSDLMLCKILTGTTHASAGTESTHPHYLNKTPRVVLVLPDANGVIYKSKASDATNIYLKSSENATAFTAFVLY
jgi:hypothetical protein